MNLIKEIFKKICNHIFTFLKKLNYLFVLISLLHFSLTFFTDKIIINFEDYNINNYIFVKFILLIILLFFWQTIFRTLIKRDKELLKYAKCFLIYVIPIGILLILVYPGVWYTDDLINLINCVKDTSYLYHLNYLTSIFYMIGCMLFPSPTGPMILQVVCFGIVASYIIKRTFDVTNGSKMSYIMYIPFFLLNTLFYTYHPNRPIMVGIFYLFLISILIFDKLENKVLTNKKILALTILTSILTTWRKENLYLVTIIPIFIFLCYRIDIKKLIKIILIILVFSILVYIPQHLHYRTPLDRAKRNLFTYINPISWMIQYDLKGSKIKEALSKIEKVVNVESLKKYPSYDDTPIFWKEPDAIKYFSLEDFKEFKEGYYYIVKNNFGLFIKTKWLTFLSGSGIINDYFTSKNIYHSEYDRIMDYESTKTIFGYKVRQKVLTVLEGRGIDEYVSKLIYRLAFNLFIPLIFLISMFIYSIMTRKIYFFLMYGMLLGHTLIVFITAPASYFMYYFNIYLCGWILFMLFVVLKNTKRLNCI